MNLYYSAPHPSSAFALPPGQNISTPTMYSHTVLPLTVVLFL